MLMPAFHKSRIESYRDDMVAITQSLLAGFRPGEVRDLRLDMTELTLRVATKTLFGGEMGEAGLGIARDLRRWLELFRPSAVLPLDLPGLPYRCWLDVSHQIDRKMIEVIADKRRAGERGADMMSMLLDARDDWRCLRAHGNQDRARDFNAALSLRTRGGHTHRSLLQYHHVALAAADHARAPARSGVSEERTPGARQRAGNGGAPDTPVFRVQASKKQGILQG